MDIIAPHDVTTEREILHLLLYVRESAPEILSNLDKEDFYNLLNKQNFETIKTQYSKTGDIDITKIKKIYSYEDVGYVSPLFAKNLIKKLKELRKKRVLFLIGGLISSKTDEDADRMIEKVMQSLVALNGKGKQKQSISETIDAVIEEIAKNKDKTIIGLSTGYHDLDYFISGFQQGHVWVLGGYTNYGKTTVAISFLCHLLKEYPQKTFAFFSLEMSKEQIIHKIISNFTRRTFSEYRRNYDSEIQQAFDKLKRTGLVLHDDIFSLEDIVMELRQSAMSGKLPEVVFIDFIQNIKVRGSSEYEQLTTAVTTLQRIARELKTCIVLLSQVNNESANKKSETIGFKGTGAIAAVADITIQVVRKKLEELENPHEIVDMSLIIQKNRHGQGGKIDLDFDIKKGLIINH
jgi:replicative DNA helicase